MDGGGQIKELFGKVDFCTESLSIAVAERIRSDEQVAALECTLAHLLAYPGARKPYLLRAEAHPAAPRVRPAPPPPSAVAGVASAIAAVDTLEHYTSAQVPVQVAAQDLPKVRQNKSCLIM
ncbi:hypothetical protein PAPYR_8699 [Paratrimastix pyriformis]|uniref:Uncharacterized protein n=1 Tax=Paratrimastix pyriformis TaxID=342808 RepID=A0ABQ8UFR3_9EUKA|nr:hypothetical protein PAPYR_8699 [Paratrimastix pyriformis]